MALSDLEGDVLARLHANPRLTVDTLARMMGRDREEVTRSVDALVAAGHIERSGDQLVPDAASHPAPGLFIATERGDAATLELPYSEDET